MTDPDTWTAQPSAADSITTPSITTPAPSTDAPADAPEAGPIAATPGVPGLYTPPSNPADASRRKRHPTRSRTRPPPHGDRRSRATMAPVTGPGTPGDRA